MKNETMMKYYKTLEEGISKLPKSDQEKVYHDCAVDCVKEFVLNEQIRQFKECNEDYDLQCKKYGRSEYFFADIIEPGHIYEIGYPRCLCEVIDRRISNSPVHCECSRQSIIYVLHTLMPDKKIEVSTMHTVLSGDTECRFKVVIE